MNPGQLTIKNSVTALLTVLILIASPLIGVLLSGESIMPYLEFPPVTTHVEYPGFSRVAFSAILLFVLVTTWPFWKRMVRQSWNPRKTANHPSFPWWGIPAFIGWIAFWILAWNRFEWFEPLQRHTFFPLWFCFIIVLNAVTFRVSGKCLLLNRPLYFILLFPVSAAFWWIFEYLNRFVNNWHYTGIVEISAGDYFLEATLAFSTVLPAVMSMRSLLLQIPVFSSAYRDFPAMSWLKSPAFWLYTGIAAIAGLAASGWYPEYSFPLIWIAPGLLWISFQVWSGTVNPILRAAALGDLSLVWASACAALTCGFFWEMWNMYSEAKWVYSIPGVEHFYLFEMPLAGYAGYLPFGVFCALVSQSLLSILHQTDQVIEEDFI